MVFIQAILYTERSGPKSCRGRWGRKQHERGKGAPILEDITRPGVAEKPWAVTRARSQDDGSQVTVCVILQGRRRPRQQVGAAQAKGHPKGDRKG